MVNFFDYPLDVFVMLNFQKSTIHSNNSNECGISEMNGGLCDGSNWNLLMKVLAFNIYEYAEIIQFT